MVRYFNKLYSNLKCIKIVYSKSLNIGIWFSFSFSSMNLVYSKAKMRHIKGTYIHLHISEDRKYLSSLFYDGGPYHIETSLLICRANMSIGFYMILTSVMKDSKCFNYVFSQ